MSMSTLSDPDRHQRLPVKHKSCAVCYHESCRLQRKRESAQSFQLPGSGSDTVRLGTLSLRGKNCCDKPLT